MESNITNSKRTKEGSALVSETEDFSRKKIKKKGKPSLFLMRADYTHL